MSPESPRNPLLNMPDRTPPLAVPSLIGSNQPLKYRKLSLTFRAWDFQGVQKEFIQLQQYFFTRRCVYLVLWKVTDGELAINELHEWLLMVQARAPNATIVIVGTHADAVRENRQHFPAEYLEALERSIQGLKSDVEI